MASVWCKILPRWFPWQMFTSETPRGISTLKSCSFFEQTAEVVSEVDHKAPVFGECIIIFSQCNFKGEWLEACESLDQLQYKSILLEILQVPHQVTLRPPRTELDHLRSKGFQGTSPQVHRESEVSPQTTSILAGKKPTPPFKQQVTQAKPMSNT